MFFSKFQVRLGASGWSWSAHWGWHWSLPARLIRASPAVIWAICCWWGENSRVEVLVDAGWCWWMGPPIGMRNCRHPQVWDCWLLVLVHSLSLSHSFYPAIYLIHSHLNAMHVFIYNCLPISIYLHVWKYLSIDRSIYPLIVGAELNLSTASTYLLAYTLHLYVYSHSILLSVIDTVGQCITCQSPNYDERRQAPTQNLLRTSKAGLPLCRSKQQTTNSSLLVYPCDRHFSGNNYTFGLNHGHECVYISIDIEYRLFLSYIWVFLKIGDPQIG